MRSVLSIFDSTLLCILIVNFSLYFYVVFRALIHDFNASYATNESLKLV